MQITALLRKNNSVKRFLLTSVAEEDRGGMSSILSTWLHLKSTVTLLCDSMTVFSTTVEPNKLNLALPLIPILKN